MSSLPCPTFVSVDSDNRYAWVSIYNDGMRRVKPFEPISERRLETIQRLIGRFGIRYAMAYSNGIPAVAYSYSIDPRTKSANIHDFVLSGSHPEVANLVLDRILTMSREQGCREVRCWMPLNLDESIEVFGEYMFSPDSGRIRMEGNLASNPVDGSNDCFECECIDADDSVTILPFSNQFAVRCAVISIEGRWKHAQRMRPPTNRDLSFDLFHSSRRRRHAWVIQNGSGTSETCCLRMALLRAYERGVRVVHTETDVDSVYRELLESLGFTGLSTEFLMRLRLEY